MVPSSPPSPLDDAEPLLEEEALPERAEEVRSALKTVKRHLRAAKAGEARWLQRAVSEVHAVLDALLARQGAIGLRLAADGLYLERYLVAEIDPEQDEALFRLFRHGVRRIGFDPGLQEEEVRDFLEVVATDYDRPEFIEDDIATLVADRELVHVQLVVVETFVEGDAASDRVGSFDLAAFVEAAVRPALREGEQTRSEGGRALPLWSADARFFQRAEVADLIRDLEKESGGRAAGAHLAEEDQFEELRDELDRALRSAAPWMVPGVFELLAALDGEAAERAAAIVGGEVNRLLEEEGLRAALPLVRDAVGWISEHLHLPAAVPLAEALFDEPLQRATLTGLGSERTRAAALELLQWFPEELVGTLIEELLLEPPGPLRTTGISALVADSPAAQQALAPRAARLDADEAFTVLQAVLEADARLLEELEEAGERRRHGPRELVTLMEAFAGHDALPVRLRAMRWLAEHGGPMGRKVLAQALRSSEASVRLAGLYLLAAVRRREAEEVLSAHLRERAFGRLPHDEKRLIALVLAWMGGPAAHRQLRALLGVGEGARRSGDPETLAAAVAALGWLADEEAAPTILRLARDRATPEPARSEAARVVEAIDRGEVAGPHPKEQLRSKLRAAGISRWVGRQRRRPGQPDASLLTAPRQRPEATVSAEAVTRPPPRPAAAPSPDPAAAPQAEPLPFSFDSLPAPPALVSPGEEES